MASPAPWHSAPIDVVSYLSGEDTQKLKCNSAVRQFLAQLAEAADEVNNAGGDRGRLMTVFNIKLESVKKIGEAGVVVGVERADSATGPLAIVKRQDPNVTHPLRQKDVVQEIGSLHGKTFTSHMFQAIAWKYRLKDNHQYCWRAQEGVLTKYSNHVVMFIKRLSKADVDVALTEYREYLRGRRSTSK